MDDINILRLIRNDFAHSKQAINFETASIKNRCNSLKLNVKNEEESARSIFMNVVSAISGQIEAAYRGKEKFEELTGQNLEERKADFNKLMDSL